MQSSGHSRDRDGVCDSGFGVRTANPESQAPNPDTGHAVKLTISSVVPAGRVRVFAALIDPAILQRCIPGCESLTVSAPDTFAATLKIGVAGMKGTYGGSAAIRDKQPPDSLTLSFDGKGGPGFVRGSAAITLTADGDTTRIACETDVQVGGLIAAIGSRLVDAAAKKLADDFFKQLSRELSTTT